MHAPNAVCFEKALEQNLTPIVVVNKVDRDFARPEEVVDEVLELFIELDANDDQLEFPVVFASGINGTASTEPDRQEETMEVLYETILDHIPAPVENREEPLQLQVSLLDYDKYVGRTGIGRIFAEQLKSGNRSPFKTRWHSKTISGDQAVRILWFKKSRDRRSIFWRYRCRFWDGRYKCG